jgi:hypothetical protein
MTKSAMYLPMTTWRRTAQPFGRRLVPTGGAALGSKARKARLRAPFRRPRRHSCIESSLVLTVQVGTRNESALALMTCSRGRGPRAKGTL